MMQRSRTRTYLKCTGLGVLAVACFSAISCVHVAGGTWYIQSAATPDGWPTPTPVGEVHVKEYPVYRAAVVRDADLSDPGVSPMFMELFDHIKRNDIAMTAPVDMRYDTSASDSGRMASMAFLYRSRDLGATGPDGKVRVIDLQAETFVSIGVRGGYTDRNFETGLTSLKAWLDEHADEWQAIGPPRFLGYNGPFVPVFLRYGEVQLPVQRRSPTSDA